MNFPETGRNLLALGSWLLFGVMAVQVKLCQLGVLPSAITWRDAFALVLLVLFWPILVVF